MGSDLAALADEFQEQMRKMKEAIVADEANSGDERDLMTFIQFYRDNVMIAFGAIHSDRDNMLWLIERGVYAFSADAMVASFEAFTTSSMINPVTGERWERADMQHLAENEPHLNKGAVSPCVNIMGFSRDGRELMRIMPYFYPSKNELEWAEPDPEKNYDITASDDPNAPRSSGAIPTAIKAAFARPCIWDLIMGKDEPDLSAEENAMHHASFDYLRKFIPEEERQRYHTDMAGLKYLSTAKDRPEQMMLGLAAKEGSLRDTLIESAMGSIRENPDFEGALVLGREDLAGHVDSE